MASDLEARERAAAMAREDAQNLNKEQRIDKELEEEVERMRHAMRSSKAAPTTTSKKNETERFFQENRTCKGKVLKVVWGGVGNGYTAERLRELFSKFGEVEDIVIKSSNIMASAFVVMSTKEAAVRYMGSVLGDLYTPLLVLPGLWEEFHPSWQESTKFDSFGVRYEAYEEESVFDKLERTGAQFYKDFWQRRRAAGNSARNRK
ncbi:hypothetical protein LINGRAHAP2_LOCUS4201 [Linum grandiflorum]